MRILGIDPGLQHTGWGIIEQEGSSLRYIASGIIHTPKGAGDPERLAYIAAKLDEVIETYRPQTAAVEETFVNANPLSALKLGQARGIALSVPARAGLPVGEYAANKIKKSIVGAGHAGKDQIAMMVKILLPKAGDVKADEADALAIAITHAHHSPAAYAKKETAS
ncbi:MAG: crossover junction endodeoxyribonuclease RuvC [Pseudobdellovibrionaceae bacterium]